MAEQVNRLALAYSSLSLFLTNNAEHFKQWYIKVIDTVVFLLTHIHQKWYCFYFRWRWPFWNRQEEWPGTHYRPSPAAGQRVPADSCFCRQPGQPECPCCPLCGCRIPASAVHQYFLHHRHTRKHPWRTDVSLHRTHTGIKIDKLV